MPMVELRRVAIVLILLSGVLPGITEAQAAPGEVQEPTPSETVTPPPLVPAEPEPAPAPATDEPGEAPEPEPRGGPHAPLASRVLVEVLGAGLSGTAGAFLGALLLNGVSGCEGEGCLSALVFGGLFGAAAGMPLGVYGGGRLLGQRGGLGGAYLGMVVGGGAALLGTLAVRDEDGLVFLSVPVSAVIGAVVGFELSADAPPTLPRSELRRHSGPGLRLVPTAGMTPRGGFVGGLSGSF